MANTKNLNLKKPAITEFYKVEEFNDNFQKIDDFAGRTDNPHGVTAEQTGSLKIYHSFNAINKALGTSFDYTTPIETLIQAMPDNTGLKADISAPDTTDIYPTIYGMLTIYKIRANRVEIEFVSNTNSANPSYNKRWIGQYADGKFGGFVQVLTDQNLPTPEQIKALPSFGVIKDADAILNDGEFGFYKTDSNTLNTPNKQGITGKVDGWILNLPANNSGYSYQMCFYRGGTPETGLHPFFRARNGAGTDVSAWETAFLPLIGGILKGNMKILKPTTPAFELDTGKSLAQIIKNASDTVEDGLLLKDCDTTKDYATDYVTLRLNHALSKTDITQMLKVSKVVGGASTFYKVFGEHNKPTGTYTGNASATTRTISTGGIGSMLMIRCGHDMTLVNEGGAVHIMTSSNGVTGSIKTFSSEYIKFKSGVLTIATAKEEINALNATYTYQVL